MKHRQRLKDYWSDALRDPRYTVRTLGRDPGFATVSILILALAIGANIAVFSVVNTLLLRPLPFPDSHQLVWIAPPPTSCGLSCATSSLVFHAKVYSSSDLTYTYPRDPHTLESRKGRLGVAQDCRSCEKFGLHAL